VPFKWDIIDLQTRRLAFELRRVNCVWLA